MSSFEVTESEFERGSGRPHVGSLPNMAISQQGDSRDKERIPEPAVANPTVPDVAVEGLSHTARARREGAQPGAPASEQRKPEVSDHAAEAGEREDSPRLHRVTRVTKTDPDVRGNAEEFKEGNRANHRRLTEAGRRGDAQVMSMTREEDNGPVKFEVTAGLVPTRAKVVPEKSSTQGVEKESDQTTESTPAMKWALLESEQASVVNARGETVDVAQGEGSSEEGFDLRRVMEAHKGPFKVVIEGEPVATDEQRTLERTARYQVDAAMRTSGADEEKANLEKFRERLQEGAKTALFRQSIAVGAPDSETLGRLVQTVKDEALPTGKFNWSEKTDDTGAIVEFTSAKQALAVKSDGEGTLATAAEFRTLAQFPPTPVPGLEVQARAETFAVERKIPEGEHSIRLGSALDNDGNVAGDVRLTNKDRTTHLAFVGPSGSGKTTAMHKAIVETVAGSYLRSKDPNATAEDHEAVIVVDCEKIGNHDDLANLLRGYRFPDGSRLPEEYCQVRSVTPGEEGIRAVLNPFKIAGNNSPAQQLHEGVRTLASGIRTAEEHHIFVKYGEIGMKEATRAVGTDPEDVRPTDGGKYAKGTEREGQEVIMASMDMAVPYIMGALDRAEAEPKIIQNLKNYMSTEVGKTESGVDGAAYQHGNSINGRAMVRAKGATVFQLGNLSEAGRAIYASALMRTSVAELRADKTTPGDVHKSKLTFAVDEASIFDKDIPAGPENAHYATYARGEGASIIVAKTTGLDRIHPDLWGNIGAIGAFGVKRKEDLDAVTSIMGGNARPEDVKTYMGATPTREGLFYGPNMPTGPVRIRLDDPASLPRESARLTDARDIVDMGIDPRVFDGYTKTAAAKMLKTTTEGAVATAWTQLNAIATAGNYSPVALEDPWREKLTGYGAESDINKRDAAITQGMEWAVRPRPDMPNRMTTAKERVEVLIEGAEGEGVPLEKRPPSVDQALPQYRYRPVEAEIVEAREKVPKLPHIGWYEKVHGSIEGETAREQLESVKRLRGQSLDDLAQIITGGESLSAESINDAAREIAKQVGGYTDKEQGLVFVQDEIEQRLGRELSAAEVANYKRASGKAQWLEQVQKAAFPIAQLDLQQSIDNSDGVDLSKWNTPYGETFPSPQDGAETRVTLQDQLKFVQDKQREYNRTHRVAKVNLTNLVFAEHPSLGGYVWDRVIERLRTQDDPVKEGGIFEQQRRRYNSGQLPKFELTELLRTDPNGAREWKRIMNDLIFGNYFRMSPDTRRFITGVINDTVGALRAEAEAKNNSQSKEQKGEN